MRSCVGTSLVIVLLFGAMITDAVTHRAYGQEWQSTYGCVTSGSGAGASTSCTFFSSPVTDWSNYFWSQNVGKDFWARGLSDMYSLQGTKWYVFDNPTSSTDPGKDRNQVVPCDNQVGKHPIQLSTMSEKQAVTLFSVQGEMGLKYSLYYNSQFSPYFTQGIPQWSDSLGYSLTHCNNCTSVTLQRPDGSEAVFVIGNSGLPGNAPAPGTYPEQGGGIASLTVNSNGTWTVHDEDGTTQGYSSFEGGDFSGEVVSIKDASGVGWTVSRTSDNYGDTTTKVTHTDGRFFTIQRAVSGNVPNIQFHFTITDPAGNVYKYDTTNDSALEHNIGIVSDIIFPGLPSEVISYKYNSNQWLSNQLIEADYNGHPYFYVTYDTYGNAIGSRLADNSESYSVVYDFQKATTTAVVTNPLGHSTTKVYNVVYPVWLLASVSNNAVSDCGATVHTFAYDSNNNISKTIDNNGVTHTYKYASNGQLQTETEAAGTSNARTTDYAWDPNQQLNRPLSITVEGESRTSYAYNAQNRLASITRTNLSAVGTANQPLMTTYAYTLYSNGMVASMIVTQPSPNGTDHTSYAYDTLGNMTSVTDGLGHITAYSNYNGLGEVGKIVGPNGDETDYAYDSRGRVASKTTHPNGTTATRTYAYDGFGLLSQVNAPDGEVTTWTRDPEQRVKTITHNDKDGTSTETFTWVLPRFHGQLG